MAIQLKLNIGDADGLEWAHPLVRQWFVGKFGTPTEPQVAGWPHILKRKDTLIAAPTGSGKTLAAFLACIDELVGKALSGKLKDKTEVLYVSPLKALGNDIEKNLQVPLIELKELAASRGMSMSEIRVMVRSGDTLAADRRLMLKKPPHILVTTPESLYIMLTAERTRAIMQSIETVIVDEIHAVADDKRGAHMALSLERLEALTENSPVRIGLSATQKPIDEIAHFLTGSGRDLPVIVDEGHKRKLDIAIEVPASELGPVTTNEMWDEMYDRLAQLIGEHRSTLIFVNTRKLAERVAHNLTERLGEDAVTAHHGSLSRKLRLSAEHRLKTGKLRALVATASLELGIDVGSIDLVCQLGSPRSIAVALQRVGRAGHWRGATPKGRFFATTRDELVECAALTRSIAQGELDRIVIPDACMDILAQQIVAACASHDWKEDDLFNLFKRAYPYRNMPRQQFEEVVEMLAQGVSASRGRYGAYLHRDKVNGVIKARRGARLVAITSGGAIPETGMYTVVSEPEETVLGTLDEDFAVESNRGDVILLGNTSWMIHRIETARGRVLVRDAHGAPPTIPFWLGEAPGRTPELSNQVAEIRSAVEALISRTAPYSFEKAVEWLQSNCFMDRCGAEQACQYIFEGRAVLGAVPTQSRVIAERFFDEGGGMQLIIHAPFGSRINKAWGLALRKKFCRSFNFELQAAATDNGINISLGEQHSFPLSDVFQFLHTNTVKHVLEQATLQSPIFQTRFRWDATRALALVRFQGGKKVPPQIQRIRADDLLAAVFPQAAACQDNNPGEIELPDHPLINETMKDVLHEALDLDGLIQVLHAIEQGSIKLISVDTPVPSQFSHEILNANPYAYLDDAPLEERRARAVEMRRVLPNSIVQDVGLLDFAAIQEVKQDAWPDIRNDDELHDLLTTFIALPEELGEIERPDPLAIWGDHFTSLKRDHRATVADVGGRRMWVAAERLSTFSNIYARAQLEEELPPVETRPLSQEEGILSMTRGWMFQLGPTSGAQLSAIFSLPVETVEQALLKLEASGQILRGNFFAAADGAAAVSGNSAAGGAPTSTGTVQFCERRLLARIHRMTLGRLRREIEPVTTVQFLRWLLKWQHLAPGAQLAGERGLLEVIRQMQGFEVPANAWEKEILSRRLSDYDARTLDRLCLTGAIGWGRLSPHPAAMGEQPDSSHQSEASAEEEKKIRRVIPTSVAPITFFVREDSDWMYVRTAPDIQDDSRWLSHGARKVFKFLKQRGASFFADIVRGAGILKSEVETALWELVTAGVVTADGFDNLRALIDPKRRSGQGTARSARPRHSTGRWTLLYLDEVTEREKGMEAVCWMLLKRYGVVFRELAMRETMVPRWRDLQLAFRRLEDRGEIRGGRFVSGFLGEQFAMAEAVDSLRAMRKVDQSGETVVISTADPTNLTGILLPGERISASSGKFITLKDGLPASDNAGQPLKASLPI